MPAIQIQHTNNNKCLHISYSPVILLIFLIVSCSMLSPSSKVRKLLYRSRQGDPKALTALADTTHPDAVPYLTSALEDSNPEIRTAAATALGTIGDPQSIDELIAMLLVEENDTAGNAAVESLQRIGTSAIDSLVPLLESETRTHRNKAAEIVTAMGWKPSDENGRLRYLFAREDWDGLIREGLASGKVLLPALSGGEYDIRVAAARTLGAIRHPDAAEPLARALNNYQGDSNVLSTLHDESAEALVKIGEPAVGPLISILKDGKRFYNEDVADVLHEIGDPAVVPLIAALKDEDWYVRAQSALALGEIGDIRALPHLLEAADDENPYVYDKIYDTMAHFSVPEAVDLFIAALNDSVFNVRKASIWGLCQFKNQTAIASLIRVIIDARYDPEKAYYFDDEYLTAYLAAQALIHIGKPALGPSIGMLGKHAAHQQIGGFGIYIIMNVMNQNSPTVQGLGCLSKIMNGNYDISESAAEALGIIGDKRSVKSLITALHDREFDVRRKAAEALGKIDDPEVVKPLITALKDRKSYCREEAALALGETGDLRAVEPLIGVITPTVEEDEELVKAAVEALGKLGNAKAVGPLIELLHHQESTVYNAAVKALGIIGDSRAVEPLIAALEDKDKYQSKDLISEALGEIGDPRAVEPLLIILKDSWPDNCEAAARALGKIGDERAVGPLRKTVREKRGNSFKSRLEYIYREVAQALVSIQHPDTDTLLTELESDYFVEKKLAIYQLAVKKDSSAVDPLVSDLIVGEKSIKKAAVYALGKIGTRHAVNMLVYFLTSWEIRESVSDALTDMVWEPSTDVERIRLWVAQKDRDSLNKYWNLTLGVLLQDVGSDNVQIMENGFYALIGLGRDEMIPDLKSLLENKGTTWLAEAYLNCGNDELADAAKKWAEDNGYTIVRRSGDNTVQWGRM